MFRCRFCRIRRPIMHGLIVSGYKGVHKVLEILKNDLISSMKNGGFKSTIDFKISRLNFNKNYFEQKYKTICIIQQEVDLKG